MAEALATFRALDGTARRFLNTLTGETISRRQQMRLTRAATPVQPSSEQKYFQATEMMRPVSDGGGGLSKREALRRTHLSPETFARVNEREGVALRYDRGQRSWSFIDDVYTRTATILSTDGQLHEDVKLTERSFHQYASLLNDMQAVARGYRPEGVGRHQRRVPVDASILRKWDGLVLRDVRGNRYQPITDFDAFEAQQAANDVDADDFIKSP
ncbi:MAG TPA: hypothetical protein VGS80_08135 [Ktedonobacterales bacterium]|nr:hypothetical protein [Ktedonobacterales bacterium]